MAKKKKEIVVRAPSKSATSPEKKAEKVAEKALEEERFGVLEVSRKLGQYFSLSVLLAGFLLLGLFSYVMMTGHTDWMAISPEPSFSILIVWIFVGVVNVVGGLLLMGSD